MIFATKKDLNSLGTEEGNETAKIIFGNLPSDVSCFPDFSSSEQTIVTGTPAEWFVVGTDKKGTEYEPEEAVLYLTIRCTKLWK